MPPVTAGKPVAAAPTTQSPQGVTSVGSVPAPTAPTLPTGPTPVGNPAPIKNPVYDPSILGQIANYYQIGRNQEGNIQQGQSEGIGAGQQFAQQKYLNNVKIQNLQDQLNPTKYTITNDPKSQYGLKIINPLGQQVSYQQYANLVGDQNAMQALRQSNDPRAQQFMQDYNNLQSYVQNVGAASAGDKAAQQYVTAVQDAHPQLAQMNAQDVLKAFMQQYGDFFGATGQQGGEQLNSTNSALLNSPYYMMQQNPGLQNFNPAAGGNGSGAYSSQLQQLLSTAGG